MKKRFEYKKVVLESQKDINKIERMLLNNWKVIEGGLNYVLLERPI